MSGVPCVALMLRRDDESVDQHAQMLDYQAALSYQAAQAQAQAAYAYSRPIQISPGGLAILDLLLAKWRPAVDQQAWTTLMSLDSQAVEILQELDLKNESINNPSAYVQRAVSNIKAGHPHGRDPNAGMAAAAGAQTQHYMVAPGIILDEKATLALQAASPEIAQQVIAELQTKGPEVRNPSAYVQRALSNARGKVGGFSSGGGGSIQAGEDVTARLDEDARRALQDLSPEASQRILQQLGEAGDKVNNPSAYVMKAVRNHQTEPGLGGGGGLDSGRMNGAVTEVELEEEIRSFSTALDDKARTALKELPASSAVHILRNLRRQAGQVTNASAWVCKAVGNMKRGPPTTSASALALESAKRMRL